MLEPVLERIWERDDRERKQSLAGCLLSILLTPVCYLLFMCGLGMVFFVITWDALVVPTLLIPDRMGLLRHVTQDEAMTFVVQPSSTHVFDVRSPGDYILFAKDAMPDGQIVMQSVETGSLIYLYERIWATNLYGTSSVEGVPIGEFSVSRPGTVRISVSSLTGTRSSYTLAVVPDFVERNGTVITISFLLHLGVAASIRGVLYYFRTREQVQAEEALEQTRLDRLDRWLKAAQESKQRQT